MAQIKMSVQDFIIVNNKYKTLRVLLSQGPEKQKQRKGQKAPKLSANLHFSNECHIRIFVRPLIDL